MAERPKRASAREVDYAATEQVTAWEVRFLRFSLSLSLLRALVFDIEFRASIFFGSTLAIIARKCVCVCACAR